MDPNLIDLIMIDIGLEHIGCDKDQNLHETELIVSLLNSSVFRSRKFSSRFIQMPNLLSTLPC